MRAQRTHQRCAIDADDVSGNDVRLNADIEQTRKNAQRRIGVQCREYLMSRHRSPECHFGGILVAHLADQNDVRILPHDRHECRSRNPFSRLR